MLLPWLFNQISAMFYVVWMALVIIATGFHGTIVYADVGEIMPREPYQSPPFVPPPLSPVPKSRLIDNGDGTITDPESGLMWTKKDSYADLGKCLNYYDSVKYVKNLKTGGYTDWRIPSIKELKTIFDLSRENVMAWDHNPEYPLALDDIFADGAAYLFWSSNIMKSDMTDCCGRSVYFVNGLINLHQFTMCNNSGVRAVRNLSKTPIPEKKESGKK